MLMSFSTLMNDVLCHATLQEKIHGNLTQSPNGQHVAHKNS